MDKEILNLALAITQQFGPQRGISREDRIRKAKPEITDSEMDKAFFMCDEIESYAFDLAENYRDGELSIEQFKGKLEKQFPFLNEKRVEKTLSQAMYFSLK
jgi:hypothetical protein